MIDDGTFPPSSRLPGERELAHQLNVSRVTVREAEIFLQARGVIQVKTGSGAYVLDPSEAQWGLAERQRLRIDRSPDVIRVRGSRPGGAGYQRRDVEPS